MAFGLDSIKEGLSNWLDGKERSNKQNDKRLKQRLLVGAQRSLDNRKTELASKILKGKHLKETVKFREEHNLVAFKDKERLKDNTRIVNKLKSVVTGLENTIKKISFELGTEGTGGDGSSKIKVGGYTRSDGVKVPTYWRNK
jgi:hypothetical protein